MNTSTFKSDQAANAMPLRQGVELLLRDLGYEICGDDDTDGWYWRLHEYDSRQSCLPEDSIDVAMLSALRDMVDRHGELHAAAREVASQWETGFLAEAIRELDCCVRACQMPIAESDVHVAPRQGYLVHGLGPDGPWTVGAFASFESAVEAAIAKAHDLLDFGQDVALNDVVLRLRSHQKQHLVVSGDMSFMVDPIDVPGF